MTRPMSSRRDYDPDYVASLSVRRPPGGAALYTAGQDAPKMLFVHGGYHGAWCYGACIRALAEQGIASAAVDLPGHGFLSHEGLDITAGMHSQADSLVGALESLGSRPVLVGHSLGGMIVALAATRIAVGPIVLAAPLRHRVTYPVRGPYPPCLIADSCHRRSGRHDNRPLTRRWSRGLEPRFPQPSLR